MTSSLSRVCAEQSMWSNRTVVIGGGGVVCESPVVI